MCRVRATKLNIQRFYKTSGPEYTKIVKDMIEELRESVSLTREEVGAIRKMAELPNQEQVAYWEKEFKPLLTRKGALSEHVSVAKEAPSKSKMGKQQKSSDYLVIISYTC